MHFTAVGGLRRKLRSDVALVIATRKSSGGKQKETNK